MANPVVIGWIVTNRKLNRTMSKESPYYAKEEELAFIKAIGRVVRQIESLSFSDAKRELESIEEEYIKRALSDSRTATHVPIIKRRILSQLWLTACIKKIPFAEGKKIYEQVQRHGQDDLEHAVSDSISFAHFCQYHGRKQVAIDHLTELKEKLLREGVRKSSRYMKALERVLAELSDDK